jgi:hypothetical protein
VPKVPVDDSEPFEHPKENDLELIDTEGSLIVFLPISFISVVSELALISWLNPGFGKALTLEKLKILNDTTNTANVKNLNKTFVFAKFIIG